MDVNIHAFLQVFQGNGIEKMEDNERSADPQRVRPSNNNNGSQAVRLTKKGAIGFSHPVRGSSEQTPNLKRRGLLKRW